MVNSEIKKKYNKPELITHDTVQNLTKAVSVGSADGQDGLN
ncbi:hypothetical protein [Methanobacterium sp.]|nr:hypothetical protein [Methanobacterium sp.]MDY9922935.1 hypothetical protein [Methanobacterium sp.]